jgi:hypothetical protein
MMKRAQCLALAGAIAVVAGFGRSADTEIQESIVEQSGLVGVRSVVTISSQVIGFGKSLQTGGDGQYELPYLLPTTCIVEVRMNGFVSNPVGASPCESDNCRESISIPRPTFHCCPVPS